ncbi:hypothetical protein [Trujillonella humicola]|uniref:hypothetical protein n=1 Tax=Trujillonella humicola TaxID=3383699 RepID=UPI003906AE6E
MTAPPPTVLAELEGPVDGDLSWLLSLDPALLAVLGGLVLVLVLVVVVATGLAVRRVRRSGLAARGRELAALGREMGVQGATAAAARRLPPGERRTAAELQLEVARGRGRLRRRVTSAQEAGAHLGEVPALLPSLEAEGNRIEQRLRQRALAPGTAGPADGSADLEAEARAYLELLTEACDAVDQAERVVPEPGRLNTEVSDAVSALRAHTAAYRELTAPHPPPPPPDATGSGRPAPVSEEDSAGRA